MATNPANSQDITPAEATVSGSLGGTIYAYEIHDPSGMLIQSAPLERDWMDNANHRFPYRCLPLNIANQNGWMVTCPTDFRVYWYGGDRVEDVEVHFPPGVQEPRISSHFGLGTFTFSLPYLFRTPPGINLWAKGVPNWIKDGAQALEGVIETDWNAATFTMNWKMTRPNHWVEFQRGEPFCMLVPIPRGIAESLEPIQTPLTDNPELLEQYRRWEGSRSQFLAGLHSHDPDTVKQGWQKEYFQGKRPDGGRFEEHQTILKVKEFRRPGE